MIKHFCDFCGKEVFHMDMEKTRDGKEICPGCMKVRCWDMIKALNLTQIDSLRIEDRKYLFNTLDNVIEILDLRKELKKATCISISIEEQTAVNPAVLREVDTDVLRKDLKFTERE